MVHTQASAGSVSGQQQYYLPEQSDGCRAGESDRKQVGRIMVMRLGAKQRPIGERPLQRRTVGVCASQRENYWMTALTTGFFFFFVALNQMWALL